jgi:hypothetical protein
MLGALLMRGPAMILLYIFVIIYLIAVVVIAWDDYLFGGFLMVVSMAIGAVSFYLLNKTQ